MLRLAVYLKKFKLNVTIGPLCKLTEAIFELIVPLVMARIIDVGIANGDTAYILRHGLILVLLAVLGLYALWCANIWQARLRRAWERLCGAICTRTSTRCHTKSLTG